jgi:hypothetical protein
MTAGRDEVESALGLDGRAPRGKKRWLWLLVPLLVVAVAVGMRVRRADAPVYLTEPAREGPLRVTVTATGTAADQPGGRRREVPRIDKVFVDSTIGEGRVIAQLDADARARVARHERRSPWRRRRDDGRATVTETRAKVARSRGSRRDRLTADARGGRRGAARHCEPRAPGRRLRSASLQETETALHEPHPRADRRRVDLARGAHRPNRGASFRRPCCSS